MPRSFAEPSPPSPPFPSSNDSLKRAQSRFTFRHLNLLRTASPASPLRVIAHIDLDAFYAQCEMVRLGTPRETPLAVQQWDSLIAINYPARAFGITRMISAREAKAKCADIVLQHVATFREGEGGKWAYRADAWKSIGTDKVCLDPYRAESRKILKTVKEELARWYTDLSGGLSGLGLGSQGKIQEAFVEKASVDEVFIDLSTLVFGVLLQRYPELREKPHGDDKVAPLPCPPTTALDWNAEDCLVDLDENETEVDNPDWDDIAMLIGAEIVRAVRTAVWDTLSYTCSAGIAKNKMMAKLGSATNKPNKQTIVRTRAIQNFLGGFKFTKIRMLGGKLGDQVTALFGTEQVSDLLNVSLEQFRAKLNDETAIWLYGIIRGEDKTEVNPRTQIKSMLSAKSFRPSINTFDQADKWLRIFAADIYGRLVEEGVLEHKRRPKTAALHHRQGAQVKSRQLPIPGSATIDEDLLFDLGKTLLRQIAADGAAWPCSNISLSVGGFEEGVSRNRAIDSYSFLLRGDQAKNAASLASTRIHAMDEVPMEQQSIEKRRKTEDSGLKRFFNKPNGSGMEKYVAVDTSDVNINDAQMTDNISPTAQVAAASPNTFKCPRCGKGIPIHEQQEHQDFHFAKDLELEDRQASRSSQAAQLPNPRKPSRGGRGGKSEKQTRLTFG
ncbi:DNA-directed DNA polymerase eta [Aspergillus mulundensis]|uniref:DNA polymerase eta n=1 Tax=Aspergillus mulundensis TaxID=1810919 RepID=A0A3D8REH5_9EURO|nr:DNA polymerase eta [Aspergillus mulundensis]RDW72457.1 DNA polymerase eta [Aspergillus mulundensis]